jgi:hypothetical protein
MITDAETTANAITGSIKWRKFSGILSLNLTYPEGGNIGC